MFRSQGSRVGFFHHHHARIVAQFPRKLTLPDIDRKNLVHAMLQQAIREAARGCPEIDGRDARHIYFEMNQGVFQFVPTATDKLLTAIQFDDVGFFDRIAGFAGGVSVHANLSRHHGALRLFTAFT